MVLLFSLEQCLFFPGTCTKCVPLSTTNHYPSDHVCFLVDAVVASDSLPCGSGFFGDIYIFFPVTSLDLFTLIMSNFHVEAL